MKASFYKLAFLIHIICLFMVLALFNTSMVNTVFSPEKKIKETYLQALLPQGWKFFTIDPRFSKTFLYKCKNDDKVLAINANNKHIFNRIERKKGSELSMILDELEENDWVVVENKNDTISDKVKIINKNKYIKSLDTGVYYIKKVESLPWMWINKVLEKNIPTKQTKIKIIDRSL